MSLRFAIAVLSTLFASSVCGQNVGISERIEVTGSHVKRIEGEGPAPLIVLHREDIARSAGQNLQDLLLNLPVAGVGSFSESNNSGIAGISLRGLGTNATLILVNGRRIPVHGFASTVGPQGISFVNLNAIPVAAIERIEVLKDGASAIYGSDAIGGVVNIILRKDFHGAELTTSYGESSRGDAEDTRSSLTLGAGDFRRDGYNVMATFDYYHRNALEGWQRERSRTADQRRNGGLDLRQQSALPGTWLTASTNIPVGQRLAENTPFPDCPPEARENALATRGVCAFNQNPYLGIFPRTNRKSAFWRAIYAVTPQVAAFLEGSWNLNLSTLGAVPTADTIVLPVGHNSNPYPFAVPILYRWVDVGRNFNVPNTYSKRFVAGLEGTAWGFDWDAAYNWSVSDNTVRRVNHMTIASRDALVNANVYSFVNPSSNDPALAESVRVSVWRWRYSKVESVDAKASGPVYKLPGGPVGLAIGGEHRREMLASARDNLWDNNLIVGLPRDSREAGGRTMGAAFAELMVPLPGNVEAQLAARHERYSDYGGSTAPKLAASWRPAASLLVRAGYAQGFRAPSLVQLYTDLLAQPQRVVDTTRCAGYTAAFGSGDARTRSACGAQEIRTANSGNLNLRAESSKGESLGIVFEPLRDLSIAMDLFHIRHRDRITSPSLVLLMANEDAFPGAVVRDPAGPNDVIAGTRGPIVGSPTDLLQRTGIYQFYYNAASLATRGVDLEIRWGLDLGAAGSMRIESINTYIDELRTVEAEGQPAINLLGLERAARYRGTHSATWKFGPWGASLVVNVTGSSMQPNLINGVRGNVASWTTVDVQSSYAGFKNTAFVAGVRNVLDREPPFYNGDVAGYDTSTQSLVGRFYYARLTLRFK